MDRRKIRNKRGQEIPVGRLILYIAALVVLVLLFVFITFKGDLTRWFRFLPEYIYGNDDTTRDVTKDQLIDSALCKTLIGEIKLSESASNGGYREAYIYIDGVNTDMYLAKKYSWRHMFEYIRLYQNWANDPVVADIDVNSRIHMNTEALNNDRIKVYFDRLDRAYVLQGNKICTL